MKTTAFILMTFSSVSLLSATELQNPGTTPYESNASFKQTPRTIMDDEIAKNIHDILASNWLTTGYPDVTFDVNNGTVNLRGVVDTKEEKSKIEHNVKTTEGVKSINNEISVGLPSKKLALNDIQTKNGTGTAATQASKDTAKTDKDRSINTKIREKMSRLSPKDYETIVIATSNGVVTVSGNVERVEDIQKISSDIKSIEGVKGVTNKVAIKKH